MGSRGSIEKSEQSVAETKRILNDVRERRGEPVERRLDPVPQPDEADDE